jgi:hypothetical protein
MQRPNAFIAPDDDYFELVLVVFPKLILKVRFLNGGRTAPQRPAKTNVCFRPPADIELAIP